MALTIESQIIEKLLDELVQLTGESRTEAVQRALEERRQRLSPPSALSGKETAFLDFLQTEIWSQVPPHLLGIPLKKSEKEKILGYGAFTC